MPSKSSWKSLETSYAFFKKSHTEGHTSTSHAEHHRTAGGHTINKSHWTLWSRRRAHCHELNIVVCVRHELLTTACEGVGRLVGSLLGKRKYLFEKQGSILRSWWDIITHQSCSHSVESVEVSAVTCSVAQEWKALFCGEKLYFCDSFPKFLLEDRGCLNWNDFMMLSSRLLEEWKNKETDHVNLKNKNCVSSTNILGAHWCPGKCRIMHKVMKPESVLKNTASYQRS